MLHIVYQKDGESKKLLFISNVKECAEYMRDYYEVIGMEDIFIEKE